VRRSPGGMLVAETGGGIHGRGVPGGGDGLDRDRHGGAHAVAREGGVGAGEGGREHGSQGTTRSEVRQRNYAVARRADHGASRNGRPPEVGSASCRVRRPEDPTAGPTAVTSCCPCLLRGGSSGPVGGCAWA